MHVLDSVGNAATNLGPDACRLARRQYRHDAAANQLVCGVLHQIGQFGVDVHQLFFLRDVNAYQRLLHHGAVLFYRLLALALFRGPFGNVYRNAAHAGRQTLAVKQREHAGQHAQAGAVHGDVFFKLARFQAAQHLLVVFGNGTWLLRQQTRRGRCGP